jgi:hypothetical protein
MQFAMGIKKAYQELGMRREEWNEKARCVNCSTEEVRFFPQKAA